MGKFSSWLPIEVRRDLGNPFQPGQPGSYEEALSPTSSILEGLNGVNR